MDKKRPLNKGKDMSPLYKKLGMSPEVLPETGDPLVIEGLHYLKIQRNLYRYQQVKDYQSLAEEALLSSAQQGNPEGMCHYGQCCLEKGQLPKDQEGLDWLVQSATNHQHGKSMFYLGEYYRKKRQYSQAYHWYQLSAQQNHPDGMFYQGYLPIFCENIPFIPEKSLEYLEKSRHLGSTGVLFYDVQRYQQEQNIPMLKTTQEKLLSILFQQLEEHPAPVFYRLGSSYLLGRFTCFTEGGTPEETQETAQALGLHYLKESAKLNHPQAQYDLSQYYFKEATFSLEEGKKWLYLAMKNNQPDSFALFVQQLEKGLLDVKTEEEIYEYCLHSKKLGSIQGTILAGIKEKKKEKTELIPELFGKEKPCLYWYDFLTLLETSTEKTTFLEAILERLPYFPLLQTDKNRQCIYTLLVEEYLKQDALDKIEPFLSLTFESSHAVAPSVLLTCRIFSEFCVFTETKGKYYQKIGDDLRAIACYEEYSYACANELKLLYRKTKNVEKIIATLSWTMNQLTPELCELILPILAENPEKISNKKTYGEIFTNLEEEMSENFFLFQDYFTKKIHATPFDQRGNYLTEALQRWNNTEEICAFYYNALEEWVAESHCPQSLLLLACGYHPRLKNFDLQICQKAPKNHEKSIYYFDKFIATLELSQVKDLDLSNFSRSLEFYTGFCYLEQENPKHLQPLQAMWEHYDPEGRWGLWFQQGYFGLAELYTTADYEAIDEDEAEHLYHLGAEEGEHGSIAKLIDLTEKDMDFDQMKQLLQERIEQGYISYGTRFADLYIRLKEYEKAYDLYVDLCDELEKNIDEDSEITQKDTAFYLAKYQEALVDLVVSITKLEDQHVDTSWCGEEEIQEAFLLLHHLALGDDPYGKISRKISQFCRNGILCPVDFDKSIYYLTQRLAKAPLSSDSTEFTLLQKEMYLDLGVIYWQADNPKRNPSKAKFYFQLADIEHSDYFLCQLFHEEDNHSKAFYHGEKFYKANKSYKRFPSFLGDCALFLGDCYEKGNGVKQNLHQAQEFYQKSSDLGNQEGTKRLARWEGKENP